MTDRLVNVLENNRLVTRGLSNDGRNATIEVDENETLPITVDWSGWLGSDTIASATNEATGPSVSGESNTTTTAALSVSGDPGLIEHRITTAAGAVKELRLWVASPNGVPNRTYRRDCV